MYSALSKFSSCLIMCPKSEPLKKLCQFIIMGLSNLLYCRTLSHLGNILMVFIMVKMKSAAFENTKLFWNFPPGFYNGLTENRNLWKHSALIVFYFWNLLCIK